MRKIMYDSRLREKSDAIRYLIDGKRVWIPKEKVLWDDGVVIHLSDQDAQFFGLWRNQ